MDAHSGRDERKGKPTPGALRDADLARLRYVTTATEICKAKRAACAKGLRSFMLTYHQMDHIGVGCPERVDAGLSMFGVDVVAHCNSIGMIDDVSHCGHLATMDACRYSKKPVTANHTAAQSVYAHARGKTDEALRAIAATGGVIGVVAAPPCAEERWLSRRASFGSDATPGGL
jgi:microsomal dipeptidase-like Zn-dependent dipeptidase